MRRYESTVRLFVLSVVLVLVGFIPANRLGGKTVYLAKHLIELISELALQPLERTQVQRVYLPYQLVGATKLPSGERKTRRQFRKGAAGN